MKLRMMILTGVLLLTASATVSLQAAETEPAGKDSGILSSILGDKDVVDLLFGEGGLLEGELPEGTDIDGMISTVKEQLSEADSEIAGVAESVIEKVKEKYGSYDLSAIEGYLTPILGQLIGGDGDLGLGDIDFSEFEKYYELGNKIDELVTDYTLDMNSDLLDSGDIQIVEPGTVYGDDIGEEDFPYLAYVMQYNFTEDDEHQLHALCWKEDLVLLNVHADEDGNLTVTDAQVPDVEDYDKFLEEFCAQTDRTPADCRDSIGFTKAYFPYSLAEYMDKHPEITGIEYDGEIRTADELNEIGGEKLAEWCPPETETEEAS